MSCLDDFDLKTLNDEVLKVLNHKQKEHEAWIKPENQKYNESRTPFWTVIIHCNSDHITFDVQTKSNKIINNVELSRELEAQAVTLDPDTQVLVKFTGTGFVILDYKLPEKEFNDITDKDLELMEEEYESLGGLY